MDSIENIIADKLFTIRKKADNYSYKNITTLMEMTNSFQCTSDFNIGSRQFDILHYIYINDLATISALANELDLSAPSLSLIVTKMVKNNLLEKLYDEDSDARIVVLKLTEFGESTYNMFIDNITTFLIKFFDRLNSSERDVLLRAMDSLTLASKSFNVVPFSKDFSNAEIVNNIISNAFILKHYFETFIRNAKNSLKDIVSLTEKEINILICISQVDVHTPKEVSTLLCSSESTISTQLKPLVKKGYLTKQKSKEDNRNTLFNITESGIETLEYNFTMLRNSTIEIIKTFNDEDKENIYIGLTNLEIFLDLLLNYN